MSATTTKTRKAAPTTASRTWRQQMETLRSAAQVQDQQRARDRARRPAPAPQPPLRIWPWLALPALILAVLTGVAAMPSRPPVLPAPAAQAAP